MSSAQCGFIVKEGACPMIYNPYLQEDKPIYVIVGLDENGYSKKDSHD